MSVYSIVLEFLYLKQYHFGDEQAAYVEKIVINLQNLHDVPIIYEAIIWSRYLLTCFHNARQVQVSLSKIPLDFVFSMINDHEEPRFNQRELIYHKAIPDYSRNQLKIKLPFTKIWFYSHKKKKMIALEAYEISMLVHETGFRQIDKFIIIRSLEFLKFKSFQIIEESDDTAKDIDNIRKEYRSYMKSFIALPIDYKILTPSKLKSLTFGQTI